MSPLTSTAEVLERHDVVLRNLAQLRQARSNIFSSLQEAKQLMQPAAILRQEKAMRVLRLDGARTARPPFGVYDFMCPVAAAPARGQGRGGNHI